MLDYKNSGSKEQKGSIMNFIASIIGRLAKDPSLSTVTMKDGTTQQACHLRVCVNDAYADKDEAGKPEPLFISVTAWNKQGAWIAENLHKGDQIAVSGHPWVYTSQDKEGYCYSNIELRRPEFTFLSNGEKKEKKEVKGGPIKGELPPKKGAAPAKTSVVTETTEEAVDVTESVEIPF